MQLQGIEQLDAATAHDRLTQGALLVDVREQHEWDQAHVPGSLHLPLSAIQERADELPRDRQLILICAGGVRSQQAAAWLAAQGFAVCNHMHGIQGWARMGLPLEHA